MNESRRVKGKTSVSKSLSSWLDLTPMPLFSICICVKIYFYKYMLKLCVRICIFKSICKLIL